MEWFSVEAAAPIIFSRMIDNVQARLALISIQSKENIILKIKISKNFVVLQYSITHLFPRVLNGFMDGQESIV